MTQPLGPADAIRYRTTLWVSLWTRQRLLQLQQPQETIDELVRRLIDHYAETVLSQDTTGGPS